MDRFNRDDALPRKKPQIPSISKILWLFFIYPTLFSPLLITYFPCHYTSYCRLTLHVFDPSVHIYFLCGFLVYALSSGCFFLELLSLVEQREVLTTGASFTGSCKGSRPFVDITYHPLMSHLSYWFIQRYDTSIISLLNVSLVCFLYIGLTRGCQRKLIIIDSSLHSTARMWPELCFYGKVYSASDCNRPAEYSTRKGAGLNRNYIA